MREGKWYLDAWCHRANGLRRFQVDRIQDIRTTGRPADASPLSDTEREAMSRPEAFLGSSDAVMASVVLPGEARFAVEGLVTSGLEDLGDGRLLATIPVSDTEGWFGRLLLLLGSQAEVVEPASLPRCRCKGRPAGPATLRGLAPSGPLGLEPVSTKPHRRIA